MNTRTRSAHGLVFLEIVFVVALFIIGALIVASGFDTLQEKARDGKRVAEIDAVQKALNLYYGNHARFPVAVRETVLTGDDGVSRALEEDLAIRETPADPLHPAYTYRYQSTNDGLEYILRFCLETNSVQNYKRGCDNFVKP